MNKELIKTNFYNAVNDSWLEKTEIPGDQPTISAFLELHLSIEKTLMDLAKKYKNYELEYYFLKVDNANDKKVLEKIKLPKIFI